MAPSLHSSVLTGHLGLSPTTPQRCFFLLAFPTATLRSAAETPMLGMAKGTAAHKQVNGHLPGQPCATQCPNLGNTNPNFTTIWNQVTHGTNGHMGGDNVVQQSLIYQVYSPSTPLVGSHVAVFDGAF